MANLKTKSTNDDRSNVLNPNSNAHKSKANNRSNQMNPNNDRYQSSKKK